MTPRRHTLAELWVLLRNAKPGPWEKCEIDFEHAVYSLPLDADPLASMSGVAGPVEPEDAELIVAAINTLPALLAEAEAAQKMRKTLAQIKGMAEVAAVVASNAWALDHREEERRWVDVLLVLKRADLLETGGQS